MLVFHGQHAIQEKILSCHNVGLGFDGLSYEYPQLDDDGKKIGVKIQDKPEGKICRRLEAWNKPPNYLYQLFMLYRPRKNKSVSQLAVLLPNSVILSYRVLLLGLNRDRWANLEKR